MSRLGFPFAKIVHMVDKLKSIGIMPPNAERCRPLGLLKSAPYWILGPETLSALHPTWPEWWIWNWKLT